MADFGDMVDQEETEAALAASSALSSLSAAAVVASAAQEEEEHTYTNKSSVAATLGLTALAPRISDSFRIKIWNKSDADAVVYDNKIGFDDAKYTGTTIGGGNIKKKTPFPVVYLAASAAVNSTQVYCFSSILTLCS